MKINDDTLRVVILSGPICAGKSTVVEKLRDHYGARIVKTRDLIKQQLPNVKDERGTLQRAGEKLDRADGGAWVKDALARFVESADDASTPSGLFVVDSVRIRGQVDAIREAFGSAVHHIHLTASEVVLRKRYLQRGSKTEEFLDYDNAKRSRTERGVEKLAALADIVVATDRCSKSAVVVRATALLGLYSRNTAACVDVLVGGQYGSEGKGNIVGHIAPEYDLLVRVGGPNAGHKVFAQPKPEAYFHLPSGSGRAPRAKLLLGAGAVIYIPKLLDEIAQSQIGVDRLFIDPQAMIIEDADREEERQLLSSISSTAQGVGAASARKIMGRGGRLATPVRLAKNARELRPYIREAQEVLERAFVHGDRIFLEGTQGTSLSLHHGKYPFVTSRDTTVAGCLADAGIATTRVRKIILVCRTFPIRVGCPSGPMKLKISYKELSKRSGKLLNRKTFFWLTKKRLIRLLNAGTYRDKAHDVLEVDTQGLLNNYFKKIWLCPMNSGCTKPMPHPRDEKTFSRIPDYPYSDWRARRSRGERVVEFAVDHGVPDIQKYVKRVVEMQGDKEIRVIY